MFLLLAATSFAISLEWHLLLVVAVASEPQPGAAGRAEPAMAARPSWLRPQQQPTAAVTPNADPTSPATQLYLPAVGNLPPVNHPAKADWGASCPHHGADPQGAIGETGVAVPAGSADGQVTWGPQPEAQGKSVHMPHKPLVFDIDDGCDDAPYGGNQAQPAFTIHIDDAPDLPPAQATCDNAPVAASPARAGSAVLSKARVPPHATAQPCSAMPDHACRQPALTTASIGSPRGEPQAAAAYAVMHVPHDMQQEQQRHPTQHDYMSSALGSPCLGLVSADAMTVPDTPPYSHTSYASSPIAPTWLSPTLTKQQSGQGKQYSPSMLSRPSGSHHHTNSPQTHAAGFAAPQGQLSSNLAGPRAMHTPQLSSLHPPVEQQLQAAASVTACVGLMHSQDGLRRDNQLHRQKPAPSELSGTVQTCAAAAESGLSPIAQTTAAATGVGVATTRQEVDCSASILTEAAAVPQMSSKLLQDRVPSHQQDSTSLDPAALLSTKFGSSQGQPSWDAPQLADHGHASAAALHPKPGAATHPVADAPQSAKLSRQLSRAGKALQQTPAAVSSQLAHESLNAAQAPTVTPAPLQAAASADTAAVCNQGVAAAVANTREEEDGGVAQQGSENADWAAADVIDDWDWQQSQLNLGFQDAFEASQGLGSTPDLSPAVTWAGDLKPAQASSASGLPVKAIGQRQVQESSAAQRVPFSNRRIPLPASKPPIRQHTAVQPDREFLTVRRPMPAAESQQSGTFAKAWASSHAPAATNGVPSCANASPGSTAKQTAGHLAQAAEACRSSTASPLVQAKAVGESSCKPSGVLCSHVPRHDTTAAATDCSANQAVATVAGPATRVTTATAHPAADVHRCEPHEQTTHTHAAKFSSRITATAAACGGEPSPSNSTAAAVGGTAHRQSPAGAATAAAPATSPAAAIFGPHIAAAQGSQSHARKKLRLQLAPRQTAAVGSQPAVGLGPHKTKGNPHTLQQPQAWQGPAPAASAEVCCPPRNGMHQQNSARKSDGENGPRVKAPVEMEAACKEAKTGTAAEESAASLAVLSPIGNSLAAASPQAATPAG